MEIINKNYNQIQKWLFTTTLIVILSRKYIISMIKEFLVSEKLMSILFFLPLLLLGIQFLTKKKHSVKELYILIISVILYVFTREGSILLIILLSIAITDIEDEYVVKIYMIVSSFFVITSIFAGNIFDDFIKQAQIHYRYINGEFVFRETFGFANPNSAFLFTLPIYASYIFIRFDKYNWVDRTILFFTTIYIYQKTMSRTGLITAMLAILMVDFFRYISINKYKIFGNIIKVIPIVFTIISVVIGTILSNVKILNNILAARPEHWNAYLIKEGDLFTFFGNKYSTTVREIHPLDSSYIYIISMLGIVSFVFFAYMLYKGLDKFVKSDDRKYIATVMMFLIYSLAENVLIDPGYNFTIIILIKYVITDCDKEIKVEQIIKNIKYNKKGGKFDGISHNAYFK